MLETALIIAGIISIAGVAIIWNDTFLRNNKYIIPEKSDMPGYEN